MRHINRLARAAKSADDPRTMDQIRADVLLDLLAGKHNNQNRRESGNRGYSGRPHHPGRSRREPRRARRLWTSDRRHRPPGHRPNSQTLNGATPSPTTKARSSTTGPPGDDPPPTRNDKSKQKTRPVSSPDAATRQPNATSTTTKNGQKAARPNLRIWPHFVATTTSSATTDGRSNKLRPGIYQWTSPLGHTYQVPARSP